MNIDEQAAAYAITSARNPMTPEAQRIAITEACGFDMTHTKEALERFKDRDGYPDAVFQLAKVPDYLNDLNAMHEAEKGRDYAFFSDYVANLWDILNLPREPSSVNFWTKQNIEGFAACVHATAAQRAEAFLRTLNLWTD